MKELKIIFTLTIAITLFNSCNLLRQNTIPRLTTAEKAIINNNLSLYKIGNIEDTTVLRAKSIDIHHKDIHSEEYKTLVQKMREVVLNPDSEGVGIAAPQIGINRRLVLVQRFDILGEPFEAYPNIQITHYSDSLQTGPEGCLSVDDASGNVCRAYEIGISYIDPTSLKPVKDTITGFTAVIFQHEVDHLEGVLFTDKLVK